MVDSGFVFELPKCAACAQAIDPEWRFCQSCAAPIQWTLEVAWEGDYLVVPVGSSFPVWLCLFCGGREHVNMWEMDSRNTPTWVIILSAILAVLICLPLIVVTVALLVMRKLTFLRVPRCEPCRDRMNTASIGAAISAVASFVLLPPGMGALGYFAAGETAALWGVLAGFFGACMVAGAIVRLWVYRRTVTVKRIDGKLVTLRLPDPQATREAIRIMGESK